MNARTEAAEKGRRRPSKRRRHRNNKRKRRTAADPNHFEVRPCGCVMRQVCVRVRMGVLCFGDVGWSKTRVCEWRDTNGKEEMRTTRSSVNHGMAGAVVKHQAFIITNPYGTKNSRNQESTNHCLGTPNTVLMLPLPLRLLSLPSQTTMRRLARQHNHHRSQRSNCFCSNHPPHLPPQPPPHQHLHRLLHPHHSGQPNGLVAHLLLPRPLQQQQQWLVTR